ncbi:MAG: hypothetical protein P9M14_06600 [Candidatus Alcyoniella australis]|nr:hypothetical protein [Candidatus Alcyoniella australis]
MIRRALWLLIIAAMFAPCSAQAAGFDPQIVDYAPAGAVIYLEAANLKALVDGVERLDAAQRYIKSAAPEAYERSKLSLKLGDRIEQLSQFLGEDVTLRKLLSLSTGGMGLALYDIGELEFLLLARQRPGSGPALAFVRQRSGFEQRTLAGREYWVKSEESGYSFAFTMADDLLLLSNSVPRIEAALQCLADPGGPDSLRVNARLNDMLAERKLHQSIDGPLFLFLDQEAIAGTSYFKVYWAFGNQAELASIKAAGIWLDLRDDGSLREHRLLLRDPAALYELEQTLDLGRLEREAMAYFQAHSPDRPFELETLDRMLGLDFSSQSKPPIDPAWVSAAAQVVRPVVSQRTGVLYSARMVVLLPAKGSANELDEHSLGRAIVQRLRERLIIEPRKLEFERRGDGISALELLPGRALYLTQTKGGALLLANDEELIKQGLDQVKVRDVTGPLVIESGALPAKALHDVVVSGLEGLAGGTLWSNWQAREFFNKVGQGYLESLSSFELISYQVQYYGRFDYETVSFQP